MYCIFFMHSSIVAAMSWLLETVLQWTLGSCVFSGYGFLLICAQRSRIAGSDGSSVFSLFEETPPCFPPVLIWTPPDSVGRVPFSLHSQAFVLCRFLPCPLPPQSTSCTPTPWVLKAGMSIPVKTLFTSTPTVTRPCWLSLSNFFPESSVPLVSPATASGSLPTSFLLP